MTTATPTSNGRDQAGSFHLKKYDDPRDDSIDGAKIEKDYADLDAAASKAKGA